MVVVVVLKHMAGRKASLHHSGGREARKADNVPSGVYVGYFSLEVVVDFKAAPGVATQTDRLDAQCVHRAGAPGGKQQHVGLQNFAAAERGHDLIARFCYGFDRLLQPQNYAEVAHFVLKFINDFVIDKAQNARPCLHQSHRYVQRGKNCGEFNTDYTTANHRERARHFFEIQHFVAVEHRFTVERNVIRAVRSCPHGD